MDTAAYGADLRELADGLIRLESTAGAEAAAQAWLEDRAYAEGMGIKAGEWELHPGVAGEFGYDSNFFQRAGVDGLEHEAAPECHREKGGEHELLRIADRLKDAHVVEEPKQRRMAAEDEPRRVDAPG